MLPVAERQEVQDAVPFRQQNVPSPWRVPGQSEHRAGDDPRAKCAAARSSSQGPGGIAEFTTRRSIHVSRHWEAVNAAFTIDKNALQEIM